MCIMLANRNSSTPFFKKYFGPVEKDILQWILGVQAFTLNNPNQHLWSKAWSFIHWLTGGTAANLLTYFWNVFFQSSLMGVLWLSPGGKRCLVYFYICCIPNGAKDLFIGHKIHLLYINNVMFAGDFFYVCGMLNWENRYLTLQGRSGQSVFGISNV